MARQKLRKTAARTKLILSNPTDVKLYYKALAYLLKFAKRNNIALHQSYSRLAKKAFSAGSKQAFFCKTAIERQVNLGAQAEHGNPYDGHTLQSALEQVKRLLLGQEGDKMHAILVDSGFHKRKLLKAFSGLTSILRFLASISGKSETLAGSCS